MAGVQQLGAQQEHEGVAQQLGVQLAGGVAAGGQGAQTGAGLGVEQAGAGPHRHTRTGTDKGKGKGK